MEKRADNDLRPWRRLMHDGVMRIGAGLSTESDPAEAARRAAGVARDGLAGERAGLAVLLASPHHAARAEVVLDAVHEVARPDALAGCVAEAVVAGRREIEGEPAIAVWLAALPRPAETFHMEFVRTSTGGVLTGYLFDRAGSDLYLLLPDPYTFPVEALLEHLNANLPGTTVMGGLVSGARGPGMTQLFHDHAVRSSGAVGVRLPGWRGSAVVSQGCRPIGRPYTVTGARGAVITELGGQPPMRRLEQLLEGLSAEDGMLVSRGLQIGLAINEYRETLTRGDFLIRAVTGADESSGAIEVGDRVEVGTTAQFHVRDAATADEDLREALRRTRADMTDPLAGALLFTCNGRGRRLFDMPDHDAAAIEDLLGGIPLAGFFAAGELGPVGGRNFLHGFTASLALFADEPT